MGPWQVSPQKWRLSLFAFLRTWSSLRRSSITCGLHGTKLQILQSNFNSSPIQFQWQTSLQCHTLSCSIYFRDPSDIVCLYGIQTCFELHALVLGCKERVGNLGWFGTQVSCNHFLGIYAAWTLHSQKEPKRSPMILIHNRKMYALYDWNALDHKLYQQTCKKHQKQLTFAQPLLVWLGPSPLELLNVADRSPPAVISGDKEPSFRDQTAKYGLYQGWFYMYCIWMDYIQVVLRLLDAQILDVHPPSL